jgi:dihydropteroate synthase
MQLAPSYTDVVAEVIAFLRERVEALLAAGIDPRRLCIDPGFGFGKTVEHNYALLKATAPDCELDLPLLAGLSRKSMVGAVTGKPVERMAGSVGGALAAVAQGALIVRVRRGRNRRRPQGLAGAQNNDKEHTNARKYFGTDGIRGLVGEAPITPDFVMRLGYAAGKVLASSGSGRRPC